MTGTPDDFERDDPELDDTVEMPPVPAWDDRLELLAWLERERRRPHRRLPPLGRWCTLRRGRRFAVCLAYRLTVIGDRMARSVA